MKLIIRPTPALKGSIQLPASKSYSIRSFIIAACGGRSVIIRPSSCDDAVVARDAAKQLGAKIKQRRGNIWVMDAKEFRSSIRKVFVRESGTVLRFILPLASLHGRRSTITGNGTLCGRPNAHLVRTLQSMGVDIKGQGRSHSIPVVIKGGHLTGGKVRIDGSLSSQFVSALLIAAPQFSEDTELILAGKKLVSTDYITMTRQVLQRSGVDIRSSGKRVIFIRGRQKFKGLKSFIVPSDYGLAAFSMAAAALMQSDVTLRGHLAPGFVQADGHIFPLLKKMGVSFRKTSRSIKIKGPFKLKGGVFSLKDCPDLVPVMVVLALFADRPTHIIDIAHARAKESDRISDLRRELLKTGADIRETKNKITIYPTNNYKNNIMLDPHKDHRLAMAFAVLGLKVGVRVKDIECVSKSYPDFVKDLKSLGALGKIV